MNIAQFLITMTLLLILITFFPLIIDTKFTNYLSISVLALLTMFFVISMQFAININTESKNLDLWLHTPSSFRELIIIKILFYLFMGFIFSLIISIYQWIVISLFHNELTIHFIPLFLAINILSILFHFFFISNMLLIMYVILLLKKYILHFSYIIIFVLLFIVSIFFYIIVSSNTYDELFTTGYNFIQLIELPALLNEPIYRVFKNFLYLNELLLSLVISIVIICLTIPSLERVLKR